MFRYIFSRVLKSVYSLKTFNCCIKNKKKKRNYFFLLFTTIILLKKAQQRKKVYLSVVVFIIYFHLYLACVIFPQYHLSFYSLHHCQFSFCFVFTHKRRTTLRVAKFQSILSYYYCFIY